MEKTIEMMLKKIASLEMRVTKIEEKLDLSSPTKIEAVDRKKGDIEYFTGNKTNLMRAALMALGGSALSKEWIKEAERIANVSSKDLSFNSIQIKRPLFSTLGVLKTKITFFYK